MPTFRNTFTGAVRTLPTDPPDEHVVGRASQWTHLMRVMRDSKRWERVDAPAANGSSVPSAADDVFVPETAPAAAPSRDDNARKRRAEPGAPDIGDRKQVWIDYAVGQGLDPVEAAEMTKAELVDQYKR